MKFTKEKIIGIVGAALCIIGVFLPFITVSGGYLKISVNYISGDGVFVLIAMIIGVIFFLTNKFKKACYSLGGVAIGVTLYDGLIAKGSKEAKALVALGGKVTLNIGFYLIVVGAILFFVALFMSKEEGAAKSNNNGYVAPNNNPNGYTFANGGSTTTYQYGNNISTPSQPQPAQSNPWGTQPSQPANTGFTQPTPQAQPVNNGFTQPSQPSQPANTGFAQPTQAQPVNNGFAQPTPQQPTNHFINTNNAEQPNNNASNSSNNDATNIFFQ